MAWRLSDIVVCGEIYNTRKNSVHGALGLRGCERPVSLQLTGNCDPDLAGRSFRFEVRESPMSETRSTSEAEMDESHFAWQQIGPTGTMTADRKVRAFDCSIEEFLHRSKLGDQPPTEWKRCLYLEWYSQNGRVVLELVDPIIEFLDGFADNEMTEVDDEPGDVLPFEAAAGSLSITAIELDEDGNEHISDLSPDRDDDDSADDELDEDPYGLFPDDLSAQLKDSSSDATWRPEPDEETLRLWAQWDEVLDGKHDEPIRTLFDPPIKLPHEETLDDVQVQAVLNVLLGRLAMHGIAIDVCEHYTPRMTYRWLLDDILKDESAYPNLPATGWVRHYSTFENCAECDAEFDRRHLDHSDQ